MEIYYIIFGILIVFSFLCDGSTTLPKSYKQLMFFLLSLLLILIAATRYDTGYDYASYKEIFYEIKQSNNIKLYMAENPWGIEKAYILLNYLFRGTTFSFFLFIVTCLSVSSKCLFIHKYSSKPFISMLIYYSILYLDYDMGILRQGISLAIGIWAYKYILEKKNVKAFIVILLASLFHISSLILFILFFIKSKRYGFWLYTILIVIGFLTSALPWMNLFFYFLNKIGFSGYSARLQYYASTGIFISKSRVYLSVLKRFFIWIGSYIICLINNGKKKRELEKEPFFWLFMNVYFASVVFSLFLSPIPNFSARVTQGLQIVKIFLYPLCIRVAKPQKSETRGQITLLQVIIYFLVIFDCVSELLTITNTSEYVYKSLLTLLK